MARKVWNFEISYTFVYTKAQKKSEIKKKIWIQILIWTLTGLLITQMTVRCIGWEHLYFGVDIILLKGLSKHT